MTHMTNILYIMKENKSKLLLVHMSLCISIHICTYIKNVAIPVIKLRASLAFRYNFEFIKSLVFGFQKTITHYFSEEYFHLSCRNSAF